MRNQLEWQDTQEITYGWPSTQVTSFLVLLLILSFFISIGASESVSAASSASTSESASTSAAHIVVSPASSAEPHINSAPATNTYRSVARPPKVQEAARQQAPTFLSPSTLNKAILSIILLILANVAIPAIRHAWKSRAKKKSFLTYLDANVESAINRYGREDATAYIAKHTFGKDSHMPAWFDRLHRARGSSPLLLVHMHQAIETAATQAGHDREYIPFLSYSGMPPHDLDHSHPIWSLKKETSKVISDFLVSQAQVEGSLKEQYAPPFFDLIKSDNYEHRQQWCDAGYAIIDDLAEHYLNAIKLRKYLRYRI